MGKFSQYKVQLANIADGSHEYDFVCDTEFFREMENPDVSDADIKVHLDLVKKHEAYDLTFHCKGTMKIPCDRCLDPMTHDVDAEYHIKVKYGDRYDDESDDLLVIPWNETSLNVAEMLYDTIMLTIPLRHVHPAGECNPEMASVLNRHNSPLDDEDFEDGDTEPYAETED